MKYKIEDQEVPLDFERLQPIILEALNSDTKEFSIAVYDENSVRVATAIITVSGVNLQLKKLINVDNKDRLLVNISADLQQSVSQINEEIEALSTSVVEQLTEYKDLFMQYPNSQSQLRKFIDEHENKTFKAVFASFSPEFAKLSTDSFQQQLAKLYNIFNLIEKRLNNPRVDRERILFASKQIIAVEQIKTRTTLSKLENLPLLVFLARELPNFKLISEAWEEHKKTVEDKSAQKEQEFKEKFIEKRRRDTLDLKVPDYLLKHPGMRQKIETLKFHLYPAEPQIKSTFEELVSLVNNKSFLKDPRLMDLYSYETRVYYSLVKPEQNFSHYNLQYLSLNGFHMRGSTFEKADLANASLRNCIFLNTNFSGADLSGADLRGSNLDFAQWGRTVFSDQTQLDWDIYGSDIILSQLKAIGQAKDLNLAQKKAEAKKCINLILPKIHSNKSLLKLAALIEGKNDDYAYLREEQAFWRFNQYGNTKTWATIIGQIKDQLDKNVDIESGKSDEEKETYTGGEYKTFLKIMDEHRGRGFGPVTHSKLYKHFSDEALLNIESMTISKK